MRAILVGLLAVGASCSKRYEHYLTHSKTSEATLMLKHIARAADEYKAEKGAYPIGKVGPEPAIGACCASPGHKCPPKPDDYSDPLWQQLTFTMDDPHYYSYAYESDGKTFTVRAFGDLDCNGKSSTFELNDRAELASTNEDE